MMAREERHFTADYFEDGGRFRLIGTLTYGDEYGDGNNTLTVTGELWKQQDNQWIFRACGQMHDEIQRHIPVLRAAIPWHQVSREGPLRYVEDTLYHIATKDRNGAPKQRNLELARRAARWPYATIDNLRDRQQLLNRLPWLLKRFHYVVESYGFEY